MSAEIQADIRYCDSSCTPESPHDGHLYSHRLHGEADLTDGVVTWKHRCDKDCPA